MTDLYCSVVHLLEPVTDFGTAYVGGHKLELDVKKMKAYLYKPDGVVVHDIQMVARNFISFKPFKLN